MEIKKIISTGRKMVNEAVSVAKEKELHEKVLKTSTEIIKGTAHVTAELTKTAVSKTKEVVEEQRANSKSARIAELEEQLEEKEKEIRILKRKLAKKSWKK